MFPSLPENSRVTQTKNKQLLTMDYSNNFNRLDTSIDQDVDARFEHVAPISDDWYQGHKVVAMPSSAFGGKSIRDVVASRNESDQQLSQSHERPRRSSSLGRQAVRPDGRDLVKGVYDRMGLSYGRNMEYDANASANPQQYYGQQDGIQNQGSFSESITSNNTNQSASVTSKGKMKDKFSGRYKAAAAATRGGSGEDRGRGRGVMEPGANDELDESEGQKRARSLSRGRSVRGIWPPPKNQVADDTYVADNASTAIQQPLESSPTNGSETITKPKRSHSFDARPQYGRGSGNVFRSAVSSHSNYRSISNSMSKDMDYSSNHSSNNMAIKDEKKENDDESQSASGAGDKEELGAIPSIKDRMRAFGGAKASSGDSKTSRRNTIGPSVSYMKSPPPPKVDIYEQSNRSRLDKYVESNSEYVEGQEFQEDEDYSQSQAYTDYSATASDTASKEMRPSQIKQSHRHYAGAVARKGSSSLVNSYLNGINGPQGTTNNNNTGGSSVNSRSCFQQVSRTDSYDVAACTSDEVASVGATSAISNASTNRKWQQKAAVNNSNSAANNNISAEIIEKMVDERVQIQLREVEARMEGLLRRWMDQMNTKITTRLDDMEKSIKDSMPAPYHRHEI